MNMLSSEARGLLQNPITGRDLEEMLVQEAGMLDELEQVWRTLQGEVMEDMKSLCAKL